MPQGFACLVREMQPRGAIFSIRITIPKRAINELFSSGLFPITTPRREKAALLLPSHSPLLTLTATTPATTYTALSRTWIHCAHGPRARRGDVWKASNGRHCEPANPHDNGPPNAPWQALPRSKTSCCLYQDIVLSMHSTQALALLFGQA